MATTTAPPAVQLRTIPLSAIVPIDGFNPRTSIDDAELKALSQSMLERGCIVPVRVQALSDGTSASSTARSATRPPRWHR
jgi:hypothetical protein